MKNYPYKARFAAFARAIPNLEQRQNIATAALKDLVNVFQGEEIQARIVNNPDLLFWASNLALLDHANLNDDALRKADALRIYKNFCLKLLDIEHDRTDVIGSIYDAGFSLFPSNTMISVEEAMATSDTIQLVVGGYIWRVVAGELCDFIETASLETSASYGDVSTSFELAFDSYEIGIGPKGDRNLNHARILAAGDPEFEQFNKILRANGGKGKLENGDIVYRILGGDILPLGAGVVGKPASGLKGILAINQVPVTGLEEVLDATEKQTLLTPDATAIIDRLAGTDREINQAMDALAEAIEETIRVTSSTTAELNIKIEENSVNPNAPTLLNMKIKSFDELAQNWTEIKKLETVASVITDLKEVAQAASRAEIEEALAKKSEEFAAQLKTQTEAAQAAAEAKARAEEANATLSQTLEALKLELQQVKAAQLAQAAEDAFDKRMAALTEEFDLDEEDLGYIVSEVRQIPDDETFAKYMAKQKKLLAAKKKKAKAEFPPKKEGEDKKEGMKHEKEECASVNTKEVVASVTEKPNQDIPNTVVPTETLANKVRKIMGDSVTVNNVKLSDCKK